ncbi:MAG: sigma-70 family RNA polymerase sigma factor [Phycisphaerales bacterium]
MPNEAAAAQSGRTPSARRVFEILVQEHADMLTAFLRSLVYSTASVDDLFQETMLVAWRRLEDYDTARPFGPWLRGIASNLVLEHRRKTGRAGLCCEPEVLESLESQFATMNRMEGDTFRERAEKLRSCLSRLPEKLRDVVELAYVRGLLLRQIAEALDAGEEAVKKRIQRAREALIECFQSARTDP